MFSLENSHDISGFLIRITFSSFVLYKSYTDISLDNQGFSNSWSILTSEFRVQARLILQCRSYFSLPISVPSSYLLKKMQWLFLSRNSQNSSCGLCKKLWLLIPCDEDDIENNDDTSIVHYPIPDFHVFSVSWIMTNYLPRYMYNDSGSVAGLGGNLFMFIWMMELVAGMDILYSCLINKSSCLLSYTGWWL